MHPFPILRTLRIGLIAASVFGVLMLLTFKTGDTDFWWHVKAGQTMLHGHIPIRTDPFAWTRTGQPYLATHEWLAQIILSVFWTLGGAMGVFVLRTLLVSVAVFAPLFTVRRNIATLAALGAVAACTMSHAISDRPQLFSFAIFSVVANLCFAYHSSQRKTAILVSFPVLTVLWVNLHGAAALLGIAMFGTLLCQNLFDALYVRGLRSNKAVTELLPLLLTLAGMCVALFCTPDGADSLSYVFQLYTDKSASFISEWKPSTMTAFLLRNGFLGVLALTSVAVMRRRLLMSMLMFFGMVFLARSAVRHEPLFALTCLAITAHQLSGTLFLERIRTFLAPHFLMVGTTYLVASFVILLAVRNVMFSANRLDTFAGFGAFTPLAGAAKQLQKIAMPARPFNNYNAGGELLFHGIPVFLDGRNVDYGYEYINRAVNAGSEPSAWEALDNEYDFDAAIVAYYLQADQDPLPYTDILDRNPVWQLTYLDDWTAVYRKKTSLDPETLAQIAITQIRPKAFVQLSIPKEIRADDLQTMEFELLRMIEERPEGIRSRLYLAKMYASLELYDAAQELLDEAMKIRPRNFAVWEQQGLLYAEQGQYAKAGATLETAITYAGSKGAVINYDALANIFKKAGDTKKEKKYRGMVK